MPEAVLALLPAADRLAVDAMNRFDGARGLEVAAALAPLGLWWFEDICDPLDFESLAAAKQRYGRPVAAGEALFSLAEAKLLRRYGGLRPAQDILLFDPAQSYGLTHYLEIVAFFEAEGWPTRAFWPHGGHLFSLQVAAALGLGQVRSKRWCAAEIDVAQRTHDQRRALRFDLHLDLLRIMHARICLSPTPTVLERRGIPVRWRGI